MLPPARRSGFDLIESTYTTDEACTEALRCVQCTAVCDKCVEVCPNRANYTFRVRPVRWTLPVLGGAGGVTVVGTESFAITQDRQILHVDDFCNECDDCQTFCVHQGRPYVDKPRLFLDAASFEAEADNAFHLEAGLIRRREEGRELRLSVGADGWLYEDGMTRAKLSRDFELIEACALKEAGTRSFRRAAEMAMLYDGITRTLPFLLID